MQFGLFDISKSLGGVIAHRTTVGEKPLLKGQIIDQQLINQLQGQPICKAYIALPDQDDVNENASAQLVAESLLLENCRISKPHHGRINLYAKSDGLFRVNIALINTLNQQTDDIGISTLEDQTMVRVGQMVATIKVIPFFVAKGELQAISDLTKQDKALSIAPLTPKSITFISSQERNDEKTLKSLIAHLSPFEHNLNAPPQAIDHTIESFAAALSNVLQSKCDIIFLMGASAIQDRHDVIPTAIERVGGSIIRFGMPVDPGNLLLLAKHGNTWIIGLPGCVRSPKLNGFDWVLRLIFANQPIESSTIAQMGVGGLLKESAERPEPREYDRQTIPQEEFAAIILAAGQSKRMGDENKLLKLYQGKPLVWHAVKNAAKANINKIWLVTGHQQDAIKNAVADFDVSFVHNDQFDSGQASSIAAGIKALSDDIMACFIILGDMPLISPDVYADLTNHIDIANGKTIAAPIWQGKRGNPVLWHRNHFSELMSLTGDVGAKHLLATYEDSVSLVRCQEKSILVDIDTQDAFNKLK